ncbi:hypothetical protein ACIQYX_28675 [Bacillus toyonensis]|uniref:hypothetical protein n=1 Tax=Bacillus toyonensis TaxID=155322 RepID=UPI00380587A7
MKSIKDNKKLYGKTAFCIKIYLKLMDVWCYPMTPNVVEDIIKTGSRTPADTPGTWKYSRADGYVILNDNGDVITAVPAKKK